jgi:hypothetical protein
MAFTIFIAIFIANGEVTVFDFAVKSRIEDFKTSGRNSPAYEDQKELIGGRKVCAFQS